MKAFAQYPACYAEAVEQFRCAALAAGARPIEMRHPHHLGPDRETLAIDIAVLGDPQATDILLSISGTHGLEAFSGSAAQTGFLHEMQRLPPGIGVVVVHCLNPYGMAWHSRANEDFVDLSRNFVPHGSGIARNTLYDRIHSRVALDIWPEDAAQRIPDLLAELTDRFGSAAALTGLTGGQYHVPSGLNFGGFEAAWSRRRMEDICANHFGHARRVAYVDFHTGFGAFGQPLYLCFHPDGSNEKRRVEQWWGPINGNADAFGGTAVPEWHGILWQGLKGWMLPEAEICGAVVEFGTYSLAEVGEAIMIDRWLRFGDQPDARRETLHARMRECFDPGSGEWRRRVVAQGVAIQQRALRGLIDWAGEVCRDAP